MSEDHARILGVIEAIKAVETQCPHAAVREHATSALAAIRSGGPDALREQAFLVFATLAGWRGARAEQVRRSLQMYLDGGRSEGGSLDGSS